MSEMKQPDKKQETPEERARRLRKLKRRREEIRRRRRKAMILRTILAGIVLALLIGVIALIAGAVDRNSDKRKKKKEERHTETQVEMEPVDIKNITHISVPTLVAVPETAFLQEDIQAASTLDQMYVTVDEFNGILQQLYQNGYVLVDLEEFVEKDAATGELKAKELKIPKGKKPLVLSQQNVNYELSLSGQGFASKLILDGNGKLVNERVRLDGSVTTGDFDVVTCVNTFVEKHPDFSHNGARGILGLTGYNGILGYRTSAYLGKTEGNKYASRYGIFDTGQEVEQVKPVIQALKNQGWRFACNGYGQISYHSDVTQVEADMKLWKEQVGNLVGETDILMYPQGNDISGWNGYSRENEIYDYLKRQGFTFFCSQDMSELGTQLTTEYLRCNYRNLDGYRMYQDLYQGTGYFKGMIDFQEIYDQRRPSVSGDETEQETE